MNSGKITKSENTETYPPRPNDWAEDTLRAAAGVVESAILPAERGQATASTLREIAGILPAHTLVLDALDLAQGMDVIAAGRYAPSSEPRIIARRKTCREIESAVATPLRGHSGNYPSDPMALARYALVLIVVVERWTRSTDARLAAIAATAAREARELTQLIPHRLRDLVPADAVDLAVRGPAG